MKVAVLGATGLVGRQMLEVLEQRKFGLDELVPLASERSAGSKVKFRGREIEVRAVSEESFKGVDVALFSAGATASRKWAPIAARAGAVVVDNSSAWRMDPEVPLVVPEVNPEDIAKNKGIIANPNCSTIQAVVALWPLHEKAGLVYVNYATYQSVSGTGKRALDCLTESSRAKLDGHEPSDPGVYPHDIAFNVLPHIGAFDEGGVSEEEWKMVRESQKIMHLPDLRVSCTTARVPVFRGHGEAIVAQFRDEIAPETAREILSKAPGVKVADAPSENEYPHQRACEGQDEVFVGRIRKDTGLDRALVFWCVADNLRKGAALNAVQIAEKL